MGALTPRSPYASTHRDWLVRASESSMRSWLRKVARTIRDKLRRKAPGARRPVSSFAEIAGQKHDLLAESAGLRHRGRLSRGTRKWHRHVCCRSARSIPGSGAEAIDGSI